jgi:non-specific serine/threonine protein kinase
MTALEASFRYRFAHFELQPGERRLLAAGKPVHLGPHAFDLLLAFVERSGSLLTKDELLSRVWPRVIVEENTLQVHISSLRKVLGRDAIATVPGRGYRFTIEVAGDAPAADAPKHNLPHQLTSFIGREKEIAELEQLLATTRLLTLTGSGGCGKTRLALQVARRILHAYPDGIWLVELAPLGRASLVTQTVASVLAVKEQAAKALLDTVVEWVASRKLLLVLDNAEHLLAACGELVDLLLRRCDRLAILVTSRERLGIAGELTYRVPSLSVPDARGDATPEEALASEAARLFIERARLQRPELEITAKDTMPLASMCRRLDGIALAIELAAPRVRTMSIGELSRRIDDRFSLLTEGSRTALPRHRTLRSLIDWSHDLLHDAEKRVLWRASVFSGGWTLEAAERVCSGAHVDRREVLDILTSLADKNLVTVDTREEPTRFGMLEMVRHYALDRLRESAEEDAVRGRHLEYFRQMAEKLDEPQADEERVRWLNRSQGELDNLRAALAWCEADETRAVTGLALAGRLYWLWTTRLQAGEGRGWVARLLAADRTAERHEAHARAFHAAGTLASHQADQAAAEACHREALAIWRRLGDRRQMVRSLGSLGNVATDQGRSSDAKALYEEAVAIAREVGDRRSIALGLHHLGNLAAGGDDYTRAVTLLDEALSISREFGRLSAAHCHLTLGEVRFLQSDLVAARAHLTEALEAHRELGSRRGIAHALHQIGLVSLAEGDIGTARMQLREAFAMHQAAGDRLGVGEALNFFAELSLASADPMTAARLWGCAQRLCEETKANRLDDSRRKAQVAAARRALQDDAAFDRAWEEGRSWTLDEAIRRAMEI